MTGVTSKLKKSAVLVSRDSATRRAATGSRVRSACVGLGCVASVFAIVACDIGFVRSPEDVGTLRVAVGVSEPEATFSIMPGTPLEPEEYRIVGDGPNGDGFDITTSEEIVEIEHVVIGEWSVEVSALNSEHEEVGYGVDQTVVESGEVATAEVEVVPLAGTGSLSLTASWPDEEVDDPALEATLTDPDGNSEPLDFEIVEPGSAEYYAPEVDGGYYTLLVQLLDGSDTVAGIAETVRILYDQHTEGHLSFDDLSKPTGTIEVTVVVDLNEPLEVSIEGASSEIEYETTMTVSATVENGDGKEIEYDWYLNGASAGSGASITVGDGLAPGNYRLDVVATTADGARSGSATHSFEVR